jgi:16S rRNA (adenine1518-N6/adenine1519-N6)-dimethyltransferase
MNNSELRTTLNAYGLFPDKGYGQHFLCDRRVLNCIAESVPQNRVLEIGPGPGCLTRFLLNHTNRFIVVCEKDPRFSCLLHDLIPETVGKILIADALLLDWPAYQEFGVVGNLPYNVSVPIIINYLRAASVYNVGPAVFMVQKEVACRLWATPGQTNYGRLSVMAQTYATVEKIIHVPPSSFWPMPKVHSSVVRLTPKRPAPPIAFAHMEYVVQKAFAHRRKMIHHALGKTFPWHNVPIDPQCRAETLNLEQFACLAHTVKTQTQDQPS